ncbi:MAG: hypothetical protein KDD38_00800 [Bdellovibrionales bacterium]|nr:hypothetical protein [Bdellovibrionales bacterium]
MTEKRRKESDDRRVIERVSSPHMRVHLNQLRSCLLFMTFFLSATAIYNIANISSFTEFSIQSILAITCIVLAVLVFRYYRLVLFFLDNESSSNLDRVLGIQSITWFALAFFAVFYASVYFIFKI